MISSSVLNGQTNVPVNSVFSLQFSKPMDTGSYSSSERLVSMELPTAIMPTTVSWSTDQTTIYLVPSSALNVGDSIPCAAIT